MVTPDKKTAEPSSATGLNYTQFFGLNFTINNTTSTFKLWGGAGHAWEAQPHASSAAVVGGRERHAQPITISTNAITDEKAIGVEVAEQTIQKGVQIEVAFQIALTEL